MKSRIALLVIVAAALSARSVSAQDKNMNGVSRDLLGSGSPAAAPGQELALRRITLAPHADIPGEVHPGMQVLYVVSGRLSLQVLGGEAIVRRVKNDGKMSPPEEVRAGPHPIMLGPGDTLLESETLVLHPSNPFAEPLVVLAASLLQAGKPQSVPVTQGVAPTP